MAASHYHDAMSIIDVKDEPDGLRSLSGDTKKTKKALSKPMPAHGYSGEPSLKGTNKAPADHWGLFYFLAIPYLRYLCAKRYLSNPRTGCKKVGSFLNLGYGISGDTYG